jgi:hypothetical protein
MKITFIVDHTPQGHAPDRPSYKKDETYDLHISYAEKYKARGFAVDFDPRAERERRQQQERAEAERRVAEDAAALAAERDRKLLQEKADADRKTAEDAAALAAKLEARGKILIPADLSILDYPALRDLAQSLSDDNVKNKDGALKAIEAERVRRISMGQQG